MSWCDILKRVGIYISIWILLGCWAYYYYYYYKDIPSKNREVKRLEMEFNSLKSKVNDLAKEKKLLEEEVTKLKVDRFKQEELVRTTKGRVKPGEKVIRFVEIQKPGGTDSN
ncbi:MAG: septum formation initiator family protein [Candidatus Hydrogenedentes bacterium]|nr:septum formation initiator family protein [Candidatus Hydrogenedentota bacterium]